MRQKHITSVAQSQQCWSRLQAIPCVRSGNENNRYCSPSRWLHQRYPGGGW